MAARVLTVTLNPAVDETITLDGLAPGQVHRARAVAVHAGGKGVNVASCLADWKACVPVTMTGFLGVENAAIFESLCAQKGIFDEMVRIAGATRTNIKLAHGGETTDINTPGLAPDAAGLERLWAGLTDWAREGGVVLLAGSLPPGVGVDFYAQAVAALKALGMRVILDGSGAPLAAALRGDVLPDCIKPNRAELEELLGRKLASVADVVAGAEAWRAQGVALVVVSMGAEGAVFVGERVFLARLPEIRAASTVGAGDAMVAGMIAAMVEDADEERVARLATAFAAAKLSRPGPHLPAREIVSALAEQVEITVLEGETT